MGAALDQWQRAEKFYQTVDFGVLTVREDELEPIRAEVRRLVTFEVGNALYGIPIAEVSEIREPLPVTPLPPGRAPEHVMGLIGLRGTILPVIDLRTLLGADPSQTVTHQPMLIAKNQGVPVAMLVDKIRGLSRIPVAAFQPASPRLMAAGAEFCEAVTTLEGRLLLQLNTRKLLDDSAYSAHEGIE